MHDLGGTHDRQGPRRFGVDFDVDAKAAMRLGDFVDEGRQRQALRDGFLGRVLLGQARKDFPAAFGLAAQQAYVFGPGAVGGNVAFEFARDDCDGAERRAQFVRGGRRECA